MYMVSLEKNGDHSLADSHVKCLKILKMFSKYIFVQMPVNGLLNPIIN